MVKWWRLPSVLLLWFFFSSTGRCSLGNMSDSHGCSGALVLRLHPLTSSILLLLSTQGSGKPPATPRMPPWVTTQKTLSCEYICGRVGVGGCVCFVVRDNTPLPGRCVVFVTVNTSDDHLLWSAFGSLTQWRHIPHQSASSIYMLLSAPLQPTNTYTVGPICRPHQNSWSCVIMWLQIDLIEYSTNTKKYYQKC